MPRIEHRNGKHIFRRGDRVASAFMAAIAFPFLILGTFGVTGINRVPNAGPVIPFVIFCLFFVGLAVWSLLLAYNCRVEIGDETISTYDLLGRLAGSMEFSQVRRYYARVESGKLSQPDMLVLEGDSGQVSFPHRMTGWPLLNAEILERLPASVRPEFGQLAKDLYRSKVVLPPEGKTYRTAVLVGAVMLLALSGFMAMLLIPASRNQNSGPAMATVLFICSMLLVVAIALGFYGMNEKYVVSPEGISRTSGWGNTTDRLAWSEIREFDYEVRVSGKNSSTYFYILRGDDTYIRLSDRIIKWRELEGIILSSLPPEARVDLGMRAPSRLNINISIRSS
jgi:hypothetical protein